MHKVYSHGRASRKNIKLNTKVKIVAKTKTPRQARCLKERLVLHTISHKTNSRGYFIFRTGCTSTHGWHIPNTINRVLQ